MQARRSPATPTALEAERFSLVPSLILLGTFLGVPLSAAASNAVLSGGDIRLHEGRVENARVETMSSASGDLILLDGKLGNVSAHASTGVGGLRVEGDIIPAPEPPGHAALLAGGAALILLRRGRRRRSVSALAAGILAAGLAPGAQADGVLGAFYEGHLVDAGGNPRSGPVDIEFEIHDRASEPSESLYSERHAAVPLDDSGRFALRLGAGSGTAGSHDALLFSAGERFLQVSIDSRRLYPRQRIGAVPTALVAEVALAWAPRAHRFEACAKGSGVADHETGLLWEKKSGLPGTPVECNSPSDCPDPHDVNNRYAWWSGSAEFGPSGGLFTDFLAQLNDPLRGTAHSPGDITGCLLGHCDWRLPTAFELASITEGLSGSDPTSWNCGATHCIAPDFEDADGAPGAGGPTFPSSYWSASMDGGPDGSTIDIHSPIPVEFGSGPIAGSSAFPRHARAVRVGGCR